MAHICVYLNSDYRGSWQHIFCSFAAIICYIIMDKQLYEIWYCREVEVATKTDNLHVNNWVYIFYGSVISIHIAFINKIEIKAQLSLLMCPQVGMRRTPASLNHVGREEFVRSPLKDTFATVIPATLDSTARRIWVSVWLPCSTVLYVLLMTVISIHGCTVH